MHSSLKEFFDTGRELRQKRRKGLFLLVEPDATVSNWLETVVHDISGNILHSFSKVKMALNFLAQQDKMPAHKKPVKCVVINMEVVGTCSPNEVLTWLEANSPEVVTIAYTKDTKQAQKLQQEYPRVTIIYNPDGVRTLLECLDVQVSKCCLQQRA